MMYVRPKKKFKLEQAMGKKPDLELFMVQHELYSNGKDAIEGKPPYTMFNGRLFRYVEAPIKVRPGDFVRIHFLNVGPNLLSTFHIVGIIWDYVYWQGNPDNRMNGGQSVTAGPSDSFTIEFRIPPAEGSYTMLSHAVGSTNRGAIGLLVADKDAKPAGVILADGPDYTDEEFADLEKKTTRTINPFGIGSPDVDVPVKFKDKKDEVIVKIIGNSYSPKVIEVPAGTTVTWVNEEAFTYLAGELSGMHNVVTIKGPESFAAPLLAHGQKWSYTFKKAGEYEYMCAPHPYMRGIVRVK
jgi:nitrite reductase (NO-forming)